MKRAAAIAALVVLTAGCHPPVAPQVLQQWQSRTLYTCCNLHYESDRINDANYFIGSTLPFGSPAVVESMTSDAVTFRAGGTKLTVIQAYGRDQEPAEQYFNKILVSDDPHLRFATFPKMAQAAITDGRVERGMTKEQVIMSLGYPPTHRTTSTAADTWVYWYNRWVTYQVMFDGSGVVSSIVGEAPTHNEPIIVATPKPTPPPKKGRGKAK